MPILKETKTFFAHSLGRTVIATAAVDEKRRAWVKYTSAFSNEEPEYDNWAKPALESLTIQLNDWAAENDFILWSY